jgi:putative flippase GtrA
MQGWEKNGRVGRLLRFVMVGFLTAVLYAIVLVFTVEACGVPAAFSAGIAYLLATGFNYVAHYMWTYSADQHHRSTGPKYLISIGTLFCINVIATGTLPKLLGVSYGVVQVSLMLLTTIATFISLSMWVFRPDLWWSDNVLILKLPPFGRARLCVTMHLYFSLLAKKSASAGWSLQACAKPFILKRNLRL